mmetsp:Transcript_23336/g.54203  ORF Transcript_23336/g.54203 Transcript_23336/m.54203 type:complete len:95 (+) Transcript_23336:455-739(+)
MVCLPSRECCRGRVRPSAIKIPGNNADPMRDPSCQFDTVVSGPASRVSSFTWFHIIPSIPDKPEESPKWMHDPPVVSIFWGSLVQNPSLQKNVC